MTAAPSWSDLAPRVASAVAMIVVGIGAVWTGGLVLAVALWALGGLMTWELARMTDAAAARAVGLGGLVVIILAAAHYAPPAVALPLIAAAAVAGAVLVPRARLRHGSYAAVIMLGCHWAGLLREEAGLTAFLWLICVVVMSDIAGYFAGRVLGGPRFWPSVSPKKTWSGTLAGWIAAGGVGLAFSVATGAGGTLIALSVLLGFAGQMGDLAESALKRRFGVKDSSALLPGHGGVLDRFDAMLAAVIVAALLHLTGLLPEVA